MEDEKNVIINTPKRGFFKRLFMAIFKLENYGEFVLEKTSTAIIYYLELMLLISVITAIASTYSFNSLVSKAFNYITDELPEFSYSDEEINFEEDTYGYDEDYDFYIETITNTELTGEEESALFDKASNYSYALLLFNNKIILYQYGESVEYSYSDIEDSYGISVSSKDDLVDTIESVGIYGIDVTYFIAVALSAFISNTLTLIVDVLLIFCFGLIISRICGVVMPSAKVLSISIYSLTLSILLSTAYSVVYSLTGFVIEYFTVMYLAVAYIYLIAAILIIKSDVIKQRLELDKIIEVQKQVKKEIEDQKDNEDNPDENKEDEEDKKEDKKEEGDNPIVNREPDGSEI